MRLFTLTAAFLCLATIARAQNSQSLVVHEWGTFTSLQDESGQSLGGIDEDVEPLPAFVKSLGTGPSLSKGVPTAASSPLVASAVTMRLETPVVYFHLPTGSPPINVDFSATFHGGLLSQWYPVAATNNATTMPSQITANTVNQLTWKNIAVGAKPLFGQTDSQVWLAPRKVAADPVAVNGQSEQYLFYRGVGHLNAPVSISRHRAHVREYDHLEIRNNDIGASYATSTQLSTDRFWYFDVRSDGKCAYMNVTRTGNGVTEPAAAMTASFSEADYRDDSLPRMREEMKTALIASGLFDDEADAMLNTWQESYFKSAGSRVFFIVPSAWVNHYLPIKLSVPATIQRVMVGRIDLVTPHQRELARQYLQLTATKDQHAADTFKQIGRFANAIVADERTKQSTTVLKSN